MLWVDLMSSPVSFLLVAIFCVALLLSMAVCAYKANIAGIMQRKKREQLMQRARYRGSDAALEGRLVDWIDLLKLPQLEEKMKR